MTLLSRYKKCRNLLINSFAPFYYTSNVEASAKHWCACLVRAQQGVNNLITIFAQASIGFYG